MSSTDPIPTPSWSSQSFRSVCECEKCQTGETNHNDESHDQSLSQSISFLSHQLTLVGGSTKCARTAIRYFATLKKQEEKIEISTSTSTSTSISTSPCISTSTSHSIFHNATVVELGAGTALVSQALRLLGARVIATDQEPMLEMVQHNINLNAHIKGDIDYPIQVKSLYWGDQASADALGNQFDFVIGSDLIFAHENIPLLIPTYKRLCSSHTIAYLIHIHRFTWEQHFFKGMERCFEYEMVYDEGDIQIWKFWKRKISITSTSDTASASASASRTSSTLHPPTSTSTSTSTSHTSTTSTSDDAPTPSHQQLQT